MRRISSGRRPPPAPKPPDATAVHWVDRGHSLTYAGAVDAMDRAAAVLSGFGVGSGGRVGLFAHPGLDYVVALLGAWRLGATAVLVDLADKDHFDELMTAAGPDAVVYTNDHFDYVRPTVAALGSGPRPTVFAGMDGPQDGTVGWLDALADAVPLAEPPPPVDADSVALTVLTAASAIDAGATTPTAYPGPAPDSATVTPATDPGPAPATADPAPTRRTHAELLAAASAIADRLDLGPDDSTLCPTPLAQPFHLEASILPALMRGATAGLLKAWQPADAWEAMERNGTTVLCGTADHAADLTEVSAAQGRKPSALPGRSPGPDPDRRDPDRRPRPVLGSGFCTYRAQPERPDPDRRPRRFLG